MANPKPIYLNFIPSNSHMKHLTLLLCFFVIVMHAQERDTRAVLAIKGNEGELSVSPDEKIWLTTDQGKTYLTNSIDSHWHYTKDLENKEDDIFNSHFERISFFNKDTAILTGYIKYNQKISKQNGYYLTTDAGKTWELRNFGADSWIYTVYADTLGNAWMGGLNKELCFSADFGHTWKTAKLPYQHSDRTYAICMKNPHTGIVLSDDGEMLATRDNWKTKQQIPEKKDSLYRTNPKITYWKNYLLVHNGGFYYTDTQAIDWKKFPVPIIDFEYDRSSGKLFAISDSLHVLQFSSLTQYKRIAEKPFKYSPSSIKAQNGALYLLFGTEEVYRVTESSFKKNTIYTYDKPIAQPEFMRKGQRRNWGITDYHLYISDIGNNYWYREAKMEFLITDCKLMNDSTAILWDGNCNNYIYSLHNHQLTPYIVHHPIQTFLSEPIKSLKIQSSSRGCFHHFSDTICYRSVNDSLFKGIAQTTAIDKKEFTVQYADIRLISDILTNINEKPDATPGIRDFKITQKDKDDYLALLSDQFRVPDYLNEKPLQLSEYRAAIKVLDVITIPMLSEVFKKNTYRWGTSHRNFNITVVNTANDTIGISFYYSDYPKAWNLPWQIHYNGLHFNSNSIQLSQFINSCIPDGFMGKEVFDNKIFIRQIADYMYGSDK